MNYGEYLAQQKKKGRSKYHAQPTVVDGLRFDSKREAARWRELVILERAGEITTLLRQVPFVLIDKSEHGPAIKYYADFTYMENGRYIVEDVKGVKTDVYKIKKRLMAERYGITIREV